MMNYALLMMSVHIFLLWPFSASYASKGTGHRSVEANKTVSLLAHFLRDRLQVLPALGARLLLTITYVLGELSDFEYGTTAFRTPNVQVVDLLGCFLVGKKVS